MNEDLLQDKELLEQIKNLTLERLGSMPENTKLEIGDGQYSRSDLVEHVAMADELGKEIMEIQLEFLQDLASGELYKEDDNSHNQTTL